MRRLLFLIPTLDSGGAEKVLVDLVNNLDENRYKVTVISILGGGILAKKLRIGVTYASVINVHNKFIRKILFYTIAFVLPSKLSYRMIVKDKYDVEISYLEGVTTGIIAGSNNAKSKKIAFIHTDFINNYALDKTYKTYKHCLNSYLLFDTVVFVSNRAKASFEKMIGELPVSKVMRNVLDEKKIISLSKEPFRETKKKKFTFISVGRFCYQKGYDRLIEVVAKLNVEKFNFELWIVGEGDERKKLENLIIDNKIDNVILLGFKENPYNIIKKSDMFICSSRAEGYSTVATEALILGVPILTTDCAGMDEITADGTYGLIVENSFNGIYSGMKRILENKKEYEKYKLLSKSYHRLSSIEKLILDYEELFDE